MLIWSTEKNDYVIDPHYLTIIPLRKLYDSDKTILKKVGTAKLLWLYHRYNPHSPFAQVRNSEKSKRIVESTFPKDFLLEYEKGIKAIIEDANHKNREIDLDNEKLVEQLKSDTENKEKKIKLKEHVFIPTLRLFDPETEPEFEEAIKWYTEDHLKSTPLWAAYESYKEAIYNLSEAIRDKESSPNEIKIASIELDQLPARMERMRQQAVKDEAQTEKISGDKDLKKRERLPSNAGKNKTVVT